MAQPEDLFTGSCGSSGHNSATATGVYTLATDSSTPTWIHLGFVPKLFFLVKDAGVGAASDEVYMWGEGMTNGASKLWSTGLMDADDGITPINDLKVTAGEYYLKEGVSHLSTVNTDDHIIGVKIGVTNMTTINNAGVYYYAAIG